MRILYNKDKWLGKWDLPKYEQIRQKILDSFSGLQFVEEGHKYFLDGVEMECVSNVTHRFKYEFDAKVECVKTYERNYNKKSSKYYHMTPEEILAQWQKTSSDACTHGSIRHEFGESAFYYMTGQYDRILPEFKDRLTEDGGFKAIYPKEEAVVRFYEDIPACIVPILAETKVYDRELAYAGTFDILFYYDSGKESTSGLYIMDWKTNKDLYKNFKEEKLRPPFEKLLDMPLSFYKLQLSLYENCLEKIGLKTVGRRILWLKPDGTYEKINLESYVDALRKAIGTK